MFCRPRRLDRALGAARPRGPARDHRRLSPVLRRVSRPASAASSRSTWATACWSISAIRRPTRTTPSARCGPGWRWSRRVPKLDAGQRSAAGARRHRHRAGRGRRPDRRGCRPGAGGRRRDAEPGGASAGAGRAGHGRHRIESTRRLLGGLFEYRDLGPSTLKGFANRAGVCRCCGASAVESRFEALRARHARRSSAATRRSSCSCAAGSRRRAARAASC